MTTLTAVREEIIPLTYGGYAYDGRIVHRPDATMAPVVLVGGAFQHKTAWGRVEQGILEAASVITLDLPGAGTADRLPAEHGFDFLTGALDHLLATITAEPVNIVGASYGSAVAYRWVRSHPERAERLVLLGTMAQMTDHVRACIGRTLSLAQQGRRAEFVSSVIDAMVCSEPGTTVARRAAVVRCLSSAVNGLSADEIVKYLDNSQRLLDYSDDEDGSVVTVPVLVATGEHDPLTTPQLSRQAATLCMDARFTTLKAADHMVHLERPTEVVDLVLRFFTGQSLAGLDYCHPVEHLRRRDA